MKSSSLLLVFFFPLSLIAQIGGISAFSFINIETSPRIQAMGGSLIALYDNDLSLGQTTPSLLNNKMNNELVFSFVDYFSDINVLAFSYAKAFKSLDVFSVGVKAINYGSFDLNDDIGTTQGVFAAHDQIFTLGLGKWLNDKFTLGANINLLTSQYETYSSSALCANLSVTYYNERKRFTSTILLRNMGRQISFYTNKKENLPFEMQFAVSKELAHLPFRYHLTYNYLNRFDIKSPYHLTTQTNIETGELEIKEESFAKTFLRHIVIGGELNPFSKSLFLRGGFNFQRRFDMNIATFPAMVGFSWGLGFKVSKFRLDYSRSSYHLSSTPNNFSIATNLTIFGV